MARKNTTDYGQGGDSNRRQHNAPSAGSASKSPDVINSTVAGKPANGGRGSMGKTIGPMTATTRLGSGKSLSVGTVGPAGAPYHDKAR